MAELRATPGGLATEIADAAGELHDYALRRLGPLVYELFRKDTGAAYRVERKPWGWVCGCDAFRFRNASTRKTHPGTCKHCVAVQGIHEVLQALTQGVPAHDPRRYY